MGKLPSQAFKVGPAELNWIFINGDGALNDIGDAPRYEYKATARLPLAQAKPYMAQLEAFWLEYNGGKPSKAKSIGFKEEEVEGKPTGFVTFTFKTSTAFAQKDGTEKPTIVRIFRGNGAEITKDYHAAEKKASNESTGLLHGTMAVYDRNAAARGITLYLSAVQFTKFVEYTGAVSVDAVETEDDDGLDTGDNLDVTPTI